MIYTCLNFKSYCLLLNECTDRSETTTTNYDLLSSRSIITSAGATIKSDSKMKSLIFLLL